jgi:hypothetical protein
MTTETVVVTDCQGNNGTGYTLGPNPRVDYKFNLTCENPLGCDLRDGTFGEKRCKQAELANQLCSSLSLSNKVVLSEGCGRNPACISCLLGYRDVSVKLAKSGGGRQASLVSGTSALLLTLLLLVGRVYGAPLQNANVNSELILKY